MVKRFLAVVVLCAVGLVAVGKHTHDGGGLAVAAFWIVALALIVAGVLHLVVNVWLTPWRVERTATTVVRVHRRSGAAEVLTATGWHPLDPTTRAP